MAATNSESAPSNSNVSESRDQFDRQASLYAASAVHRHGPSLPVLVEFAHPTSQDVALDVATGTGNAAFAIADAGASVVGLDVATKMLAQAQSRADAESYANVRFEEGSAESIPFDDASFSLVVARHAPHHFRDAGRFLHEVRRVLKPDGRFVMADQVSPEDDQQTIEWVHAWQQRRDPSHFKQRTIAEWKELAAEAGMNWIRETLVPYRMETDWWFRQAGADESTIAFLKDHAKRAPAHTRAAVNLEYGEDGDVIAFTDQMLVVRLEPTAT